MCGLRAHALLREQGVLQGCRWQEGPWPDWPRPAEEPEMHHEGKRACPSPPGNRDGHSGEAVCPEPSAWRRALEGGPPCAPEEGSPGRMPDPGRRVSWSLPVPWEEASAPLGRVRSQPLCAPGLEGSLCSLSAQRRGCVLRGGAGITGSVATGVGSGCAPACARRIVEPASRRPRWGLRPLESARSAVQGGSVV